MSAKDEAVPQAAQAAEPSAEQAPEVGCSSCIAHRKSARAHAVCEPSLPRLPAHMLPQSGAAEAQQPASDQHDNGDGAPVAMSKSQMKKQRKRQL